MKTNLITREALLRSQLEQIIRAVANGTLINDTFWASCQFAGDTLISAGMPLEIARSHNDWGNEKNGIVFKAGLIDLLIDATLDVGKAILAGKDGNVAHYDRLYKTAIYNAIKECDAEKLSEKIRSTEWEDGDEFSDDGDFDNAQD